MSLRVICGRIPLIGLQRLQRAQASLEADALRSRLLYGAVDGSELPFAFACLGLEMIELEGKLTLDPGRLGYFVPEIAVSTLELVHARQLGTSPESGGRGHRSCARSGVRFH